MKKKKNKKITELASAFGRLGGKATAKKGRAYMQEIGRKGAEARWNKINN